MSIENNTGKPARLSLAQRAACGLPIDLSRKAGLDIDDVCWLEHTDDAAQQARLCAKLETAIGLYPRLARPFSIGGCPAGWLIRRSAYRAWRTARSPSSLLSETSDIALWLGATPGPEPAETSLPEKQERPDVIKHAIRAAIAVLSPSGALPRSPELFDYILQNSGKGNKFPDLTVKGKSLLWTADNGSRKEFDIRALTERLRRWKG